MAKIDVTKIDGYADMTAEEKLKALEGYEIPDPDYSGYVKKDIFDKAAHELAEKKKELNDKLSDEEKAKLEAQNAQKELSEKYEALLRENTISKNKAKYLGLGYDEKLAEETAIAVADNDLDKVFANEKKNLEAQEKRIKAEILKDTPKPKGGSESKTMTLDKFKKLSPSERLEFSETHADEYKSLYTDTGED